MKNIGILGGMGPEATAEIYMKIIRLFQDKYGAKYDSDFPQIIINSIPLPDVVEKVVSQVTVSEILIQNALLLEKAGADFIIIPCNSVSNFIPEIRRKVNVPVLSIIEEAVKEIRVNTIGLLATNYTIASKLYENIITAAGKKLILPNNNEQKIITEVIMAVLANKEIDAAKIKLKNIIAQLRGRGAEQIVLGCTDLPFVSDKTSYLVDTLEVLSRRAVEMVFEEDIKIGDQKIINQQEQIKFERGQKK